MTQFPYNTNTFLDILLILGGPTARASQRGKPRTDFFRTQPAEIPGRVFSRAGENPSS